MLDRVFYVATNDTSSPEFHTFVEVCEASPLFQAKIKEFKLPPGFEVIIEVRMRPRCS